MMNQIFEGRLQEVAQHYQSGDYHLGLRRMLDAALETRNTAIFEKTLAFCQLTEESSSENIVPSALTLLQAISAAGVRATAQADRNVVSVNNISKQYRGGKFKLSPVNLNLRAGDVVGLVGENGNGKTTLLRIMAGELHPDTGEIKYAFSQPVTNNYEKRSHLAFVQQRIPRWWGTLTDNLHFAARHYGLMGRENELWVEMIIARLGLRQFRSHSWNSLSSGYRTRFELARTLLRSPEILLLDEPLANLDIISQQTILHDLRFLAQSQSQPMAVVLSSQQIYEVEKISDRIVFLKQGEPIYQDLKNADATAAAQTLFEIETTATRDELLAAFQTLAVQHIQFNGGVFIAAFSGQVTASAVMNNLAGQAFEVSYFRNISQSSRRFFAHA